jgi:undecaprenyl-diphosphatase
MLGVVFKLFIKSSDRAYFMANIPSIAISNVVALISGLLAVKFVMGYLAKHDLAIFGWYRVAVSVVVAVVLLLQ